jgi:hypothetical protein
MATSDFVNQGKTLFVETYFESHPDGTLETVNDAWSAAGYSGTLSESLVGKVRARLGLTGKKRSEAPQAIEAPAKANTKSPGRPKKVAKPVEKAKSASNGSRTPATTQPDDDDEVLDELEESIDELIQKIRVLGDKPDVVKALRRARRLLVRSHEG